MKPPAIIMKVDGPADENSKEENEKNENAEQNNVVDTSPSQVCSPIAKPVLRPSQLGYDPSSMNVFGGSSILRPSHLGSRSAATGLGKTPFSLNPSRLNPFSKTLPMAVDSNSDTNDVDKKNNQPQSNGDTPKFVPLLQADRKPNELPAKQTASVATTSISNSNNFVFGQNLQDRVIADSKSDEPKPSTSCLNSNGTTEMLFSSAIKDKPGNISSSSSSSKETKSLSESAREYEESRANKRKYEEVEIKTGEEEETNVLQISCKLFAFDKTSGSWQERGRGNLRLNDFEVTGEEKCTFKQSRLVFRAAGSLRVILNTKIWADMTIDQASAKSIRLTALDSSGEIKVFLVMANHEEIKQLYKLLEERLNNEKNKIPPFRKTETSIKKQATDSGGQ